MRTLIDAVNIMRDIPHVELGAAVKHVAVIVASPRSGSSLVTKVLSSHSDIASMDGEIEPFLSLTGNGFGFNSDSDALSVLSNLSELVDNIFDNLTVLADKASPTQLKKQWAKRLVMQFPAKFSDLNQHQKLLQALDVTLTQDCVNRYPQERHLQHHVLSRIFSDEPWRMAYYDGEKKVGAGRYFDEAFKIEEPPFVVPRRNRRPFSDGDADKKMLLFKTSTDVYRVGMYEQLFPNADIKYIHLTRGYAQTVNGLMDGWLSPVGFFSHNLGQTGFKLNIKGYSDAVPFGKNWWKFDLPPNWRNYIGAHLEDICLNQWISSHREFLNTGVPALQIAFESFLMDPTATVRRITNYLGLASLQVPEALPVTMATEMPGTTRWKRREDQLMQLGTRLEVRSMMDTLGYTMNSERWI
ncbi:hypothetical protein [Solimicrobium silvestre]|uniref:Sulfotransferase family n=1 Tax=Solimicrobium silvestre TaxID=2099400 RepID=A0A2S9GXR9_9BURK|nr:hypothetical protein [Solimicrobium silvestre]PRC92509.1 hypothetical protein S2091_2884 [Solimicrobium silvestre]